MDSIINVFERRFKQLNWIIDIKKLQDMLKIKTQEGIEYICKKQHIENQTKIIVKDLALNFCYENKINDSMENDNFIKDNILIKLEAEIYKNDICLKAFKKGLVDFKERNQEFNIDSILNTDLYSSFIKNNESISLIEFLWNKGYEFSSRYPYPEEVDKQYNYIAEKTINILSVEDLKEFIKKNPEIYTYFDEKKIPENIASLKDFREIDYSYKNIVAKMYTKIGKLNEKILVFDTEGIKEFANCHIEDYQDIYNSKLIEEMFKCKELYEKIEIKMKLIQLLEEKQGLDFDICDNTYDYEVAFVMNDEEPKDNYEKYLRHLAENLDVVNVNNKAGNVVVDIAGYIEKNIETYEKLFEDNDIENNIYRTINMITGNASENVYKDILKYLGENTIEEEKEENEQEE